MRRKAKSAIKHSFGKPVRIDGEWWFDYHGDEIGPYDTKDEAEEGQQGLARFDRDNPEFVPTPFEELCR